MGSNVVLVLEFSLESSMNPEHGQFLILFLVFLLFNLGSSAVIYFVLYVTEALCVLVLARFSVTMLDWLFVFSIKFLFLNACNGYKPTL